MSSQLSAATLNGDCHSAKVDRAALQHAMQTQGEPWHGLVTERCPHLFADVPVFIAPAQLRQMREVIEAGGRGVINWKWGGGKGGGMGVGRGGGVGEEGEGWQRPRAALQPPLVAEHFEEHLLKIFPRSC